MNPARRSAAIVWGRRQVDRFGPRRRGDPAAAVALGDVAQGAGLGAQDRQAQFSPVGAVVGKVDPVLREPAGELAGVLRDERLADRPPALRAFGLRHQDCRSLVDGDRRAEVGGRGRPIVFGGTRVTSAISRLAAVTGVFAGQGEERGRRIEIAERSVLEPSPDRVALEPAAKRLRPLARLRGLVGAASGLASSSPFAMGAMEPAASGASHTASWAASISCRTCSAIPAILADVSGSVRLALDRAVCPTRSSACRCRVSTCPWTCAQRAWAIV